MAKRASRTFFTVDQDVGNSRECIRTQVELSTSGRFQDIAVKTLIIFAHNSVLPFFFSIVTEDQS